MARGAQRNGRRNGNGNGRSQGRAQPRDNEGIIPVLAQAVREVEGAVARGSVKPSVRTKFQVVALLVREERARVKADATSTEAHRAKQLKRLDGIATILAKTAARDTSLLALLAEDAEVSESARTLTLRDAGRRRGRAGRRATEPASPSCPSRRRRTVVPQSVVSRQLANPFLRPGLLGRRAEPGQRPRLAGWELLGPLFRSFEQAAVRPPPACRCPSRSASRRPAALRADAPPGPGGGRARLRATAPSCSPTSPASARPPRRCSPRRPPTPTRCWSSCPTS